MITFKEVLEAIITLKRKKSGGIDNLLNEMIYILDICNAILKTGIYPDILRDKLVKPIFKGETVPFRLYSDSPYKLPCKGMFKNTLQTTSNIH